MRRNKRFKFWVSASLICLWLIAPFQSAFAEGPNDPAPVLVPTAPNGKSVLFDNTHGQTAGAADWVIDGGFSDFGNALHKKGYKVSELRATKPITLSDLEKHDVFVIPEANIPFKTSEQAAIAQYVQAGGSVFFISDHYNADRNKNRWDSSEVMNGYRRGAYTDPAKGMSQEEKQSEAMKDVQSSDWLATNFGVRYRYNAVGDVNATKIVAPSESFGITEGVKAVAMHAGSTLAITDPRKAKGIVYLPDGLTSSQAWGPAVDQGVYAGGGVKEGPYAAVAKKGLGKAAFIGDSSPVEDATPKYLREDNGKKKTTYDGFQEQNDGTLLVNIIDWLAKKESYTTLTETGIPLDETTPLLNMEIPENSTEPQSEPWAAPDPGYKWYDRSTFKPGSYGAQSGPIGGQLTYSIIRQSVLPAEEAFEMKVKLEGLQPGQTIQQLKVGIYKDGGEQIAAFQLPDGKWTPYDYSPVFSVTANDKGIGTNILRVKLKPNSIGTANLRIKQGSNNVLTEKVTIDKVKAEPLPEETTVLEGTISDVRSAKIGQMVKTKGIVTSKSGLFGGKGFYVQDETAGVYVFQTQTDVEPGDVVEIEATTALYNDEFELEDVTKLTITGKTAVPTAKDVETIDATNQGELVAMKEITISEITQKGSSFEMKGTTKSGAEILVRVDGRTGIAYEAFIQKYKLGDQVNVTGISSIFKGSYQLKPLQADHIQLIDVTPPTISDLGKTVYSVIEAFSPVVEVTDDHEVVSVKYMLNGKEWNVGQTAEALSLQPGVYKFDVEATDAFGNKAVRSFDIKIELPVEHFDEFLQLCQQKGWFYDQHSYKFAETKVKVIQKMKTVELQRLHTSILIMSLEAQSPWFVDQQVSQFLSKSTIFNK